MQNYLKRGFTLIETLIVVAIVLVLAGMAVPTFKDSIADAEVASVKQELQRVRTAIDYYGFQHQGQLPGWDGITWSEIALRSQLMMATDSAGNWANIGTSGYPFGPYLTEGFPANPFNQLDTVLITTDSASFPAPDDSTGWVFFTSLGLLRANTTALSPAGEPVFEL